MQSGSSAGTYVYCIGRAAAFADDNPPLHAQAIGGRGDAVRTIHFLDLTAVISDSPVARYDVSRANTLAHQLVLEEAMARSEILPVRFGTVARNDWDVQDKLLRRKFGELHHLMHSIHGRAELGLKMFWKRERLFAGIASESNQVRALRDAIVGKPPEQTHYQRVQLGQLTEEAIIHRRDQQAEAILEALRPVAVETRVNKILTDMMVLNAAFLVERDREPEFDARLNALDELYAGDLIFRYVGPVPPYNFVDIVVHWEED